MARLPRQTKHVLASPAGGEYSCESRRSAAGRTAARRAEAEEGARGAGPRRQSAARQLRPAEAARPFHDRLFVEAKDSALVILL